MNAGILGNPSYERYLCASSTLREDDVDPRPREMSPSDKNEILRAVDSQAKVLSNPHTAVDILD
jgi:hypothetical protein